MDSLEDTLEVYAEEAGWTIKEFTQLVLWIGIGVLSGRAKSEEARISKESATIRFREMQADSSRRSTFDTWLHGDTEPPVHKDGRHVEGVALELRYSPPIVYTPGVSAFQPLCEHHGTPMALRADYGTGGGWVCAQCDPEEAKPKRLRCKFCNSELTADGDCAAYCEVPF